MMNYILITIAGKIITFFGSHAPVLFVFCGVFTIPLYRNYNVHDYICLRMKMVVNK